MDEANVVPRIQTRTSSRLEPCRRAYNIAPLYPATRPSASVSRTQEGEKGRACRLVRYLQGSVREHSLRSEAVTHARAHSLNSLR